MTPGSKDDSQRSEGRVALRLRLGVTGHRFPPEDDPELRAAVGIAISRIQARIRPGTESTPVSLAVVSALAEGSDRIVAREALARGASLEVVLPLAREDYLADFCSGESQTEFLALCELAASVTEMTGADGREQAYEQAGRAIVDRCDVMLAIWDGLPARGRGGTAEIVAYAHQQRVPLLRIAVGGQDAESPVTPTVHSPDLPESLGPLTDAAFAHLNRFNGGQAGARRNRGQELMPDDPTVAVPPHVLWFVQFVLPFFGRAERVAQSSQQLFLRLTLLLYSLAAGAVCVVATQVIFLNRSPHVVWAEVVALVAVVITLALGRRARWHDRWIAARYLAERIRSGVFLAATGAGDDLRPLADMMRMAGSDRPDPNREWAERAFREIYWRAPRYPIKESELPVLQELLMQAWIDDQARYHKKAHDRLHKRQRLLTSLAIGLFAVSAMVALFHSLSWFEPPSGRPDIWGYLSVVIPAIGAALAGYGAQREYARQAERSAMMVIRLAEARQMLEDISDLAGLRRAARSIELLMRSDTADWYDVVRLHDFELPA